MTDFFSKLPPWLFTIITVMAILWLTLAPKPLGDEAPMLFEGADKVVHAIMFGGLTAMILLDWQRKNRWQRITWMFALIVAAVSSIFGIIIEFAQLGMHMGRGFEQADILADTIGAFAFALIWMFLQNIWLQSDR